MSSRVNNVEVPSLVLIQRVACLVLDTGGDGSSVARAILQRISRGKGGHLSEFVVNDTARSCRRNLVACYLIKKLEGVRIDGGGVHVFGEGGSRLNFGSLVRG